MARIVSEKYAVMLLHSEFLKNPKFSKYRKYIEDELTLDKLEPDEVETINNQRADWIRNSMAEWRLDDIKPMLSIKNDFHGKSQRCQLCNAKLDKHVYHVCNKVNGNQLFIGGTCLDHVVNREPGMNVGMTAEQYARQNEFKQAYPEIMSFLANAPSNDAPFEVSEKIIKRETELRRQSNLLLKQYRENNRKYGLIIKVVNDIGSLPFLIKQDMKKKTEENSLALSLRRQLEVDQKSSLAKIRTITQQNSGFLNTEAAAKILDKKFCLRYLSKLLSVNDVNESGIADFELTNIGHCRVKFSLKGRNVSYTVPTSRIIGVFEYPASKVLHAKSVQLIRSDITPDINESSDAILAEAYETFNNYGFRLYSLTTDEFKQYFEKRQVNLPIEERTNFSVSKYKRIQARSIVFRIGQRYCIINAKNLLKVGADSFVSRFLGEGYVNPRIETMDRDDLFKSLQLLYDASGSTKLK